MKEKSAALYSEYIIDGIPQTLTPARMLESVCACKKESAGEFEPIVDETVDPVFKALEFDSSLVGDYLRKTASAKERRSFPAAFSPSLTKCAVAKALIDAIWRKGHFCLDDLALSAKWKWDMDKIGSMASFYASVEAAAEYIDSLGLGLASYDVERSRGNRVEFSVLLDPEKLPYSSEEPVLGGGRAIPDALCSDKDSWIIYIPFESCEPRLGGSVLAEQMKASGGIPLDIGDADYFMDCYEVVREIVEDRVAISGTTVCPGGLLTALKKMTGLRTGARIDLSGLISATGEKDIVRLLFAETPGAIIQIRDIDYDYVEAELLLQDVVFYPLGHPKSGNSDIEIAASDKTGLQTILESLINSQSSEGED